MFMLHCPQGEGSLVVLMDYGEGVWGWGGAVVAELLPSSVLMARVKWLRRCDVLAFAGSWHLSPPSPKVHFCVWGEGGFPKYFGSGSGGLGLGLGPK